MFWRCLLMSTLLAMLVACSPRGYYNDPADPGYDPNYPTRLRPVELPPERDGEPASYRDDMMSIFLGEWRDPRPLLARVEAAVAAKAPGHERLKARYLDLPGEHSVQGLIDDDLVGLDIELFLGRGVVLSAGEGCFRVLYGDGTSCVDRGVRVDLSPNEDKPRMRRSRANAPLELRRSLRRAEDAGVRVVLLMPLADLGKDLAGVEVTDHRGSVSSAASSAPAAHTRAR